MPSKDEKGRRKGRRVVDEEETSSSESDVDECYEPLGAEAWRYPMYSPSASYRQMDVVSGSHQYSISGFPLARSMGCGSRLCSDFFEVCGQLFRLEVYPGGFSPDASRYVAVFLTTPGSANPNHVMYELAILDQSGKDRHIIEKQDVQSRLCKGGGFAGCCHMQGPMMSHSRGIIAAMPKFIKAGFLFKQSRRYLPCDTLVLRATVQVVRGWSSAPRVHDHLAYGQGAAPGAAFGCCGPMMPGLMAPTYPGAMQHPQQLQQHVSSPYSPAMAACPCGCCQHMQGAGHHSGYHVAPVQYLAAGPAFAAPANHQQVAYQQGNEQCFSWVPLPGVIAPSIMGQQQQQQQQPPSRMTSSQVMYAPVSAMQNMQHLPLPGLPFQTPDQHQAWSGGYAASPPTGGAFTAGRPY